MINVLSFDLLLDRQGPAAPRIVRDGERGVAFIPVYEPRYQMPDTGCQMSDIRYQIPDARCQIDPPIRTDTRYQIEPFTP
jgi:hypothetical protein